MPKNFWMSSLLLARMRLNRLEQQRPPGQPSMPTYVLFYSMEFSGHVDSAFSTFLLLHYWLASKQQNSIKATLTPTSTIIWRFVRLAKYCDTWDDIIFQGTVPVPAFTKPVLLVGRENMNRAVHGDVVVVEVFDESEWKAPADEVVDQEGASSSVTVLSFPNPNEFF